MADLGRREGGDGFFEQCTCHLSVLDQDFEEDGLVELAAFLVAGGAIQRFRGGEQVKVCFQVPCPGVKVGLDVAQLLPDAVTLQ